MIWLFLVLSIVCEVIATTALRASDGFTKLFPSVITVCFYAAAFYSLTFPMRMLPTGVIYAIWSGAGIVLISLIGWLYQGQKIDLPAVFGISLIVAGVVVINLFSKAAVH